MSPRGPNLKRRVVSCGKKKSFAPVSFRGSIQLQELVAGVDDVRGPVADGAHAEVEPAAPVAGMVLAVVVVPLGGGEPGIPVHARREGLLLREFLDIHVIGMPAAPVVVVRDDLVDVLDDAGVLPGLELEVVRLGVALVAHLRGELGVLPRGRHQQFALVEGARHGLFHIDVLAAVEGEHRDREMREVRDGDAHGVEVVRVLVEELAEILEQLRLGVFGDGLAALGALAGAGEEPSRPRAERCCTPRMAPAVPRPAVFRKLRRERDSMGFSVMCSTKIMKSCGILHTFV